MEIKFNVLKIPSDLLPHSEDEIDQFNEIAGYIYESILHSQPSKVNLDEKIIPLSSFLQSKMVEGLLENIYHYMQMLKGAKYLSGDISISISEAITYTTLHTIYSVKLRNIIPFRTVKYLGIIADAVVDLSREEKLAKEVGSDSGLLFINIRSSMNPKSYQIIDKIRRSLINIETVRYPDSFGLISIVTLDKGELTNSFVFIIP
ncbi:hypothetical protein SUSAZ_04170 [Sulfolobus acidocaldarius SUSAZ]|nr:hypothetical protein SUSAZ_04170 [Sulfolobus acidocaldarius SUSAZ]